MREIALAMVAKPLRETAYAAAVSFVVTPLAVVLGIGFLVVGNPIRLVVGLLGLLGVMSGDTSIDWGHVGGGLAAWTVLIWGILALSFAWTLSRHFRRYRRLCPAIKSGTEYYGQVAEIDRNTRKNSGGISFTSMSVRIDCSGNSLYGFLEEPVGTQLPKLSVGIQVTAWLLGDNATIVWDSGFMPASTRPLAK